MVPTTLEIKTLTPIWTGDADGKCSEIKETGIIGSMRWWYEAIVRGLGGYACDPTSDDKCELDDKKLKKSLESGMSVQDAMDEQICPACQLFGCTGWRRRFRVEIESVDAVELNFVNKLSDINAGWWIRKTLNADPKAFYFSNTAKLKLISEDKEIENKILVLLKLIEDIGSFGAKAQNGFGLTEFIFDRELTKQILHDEVVRYNKKNPNKSNPSEFRALNNFYKFMVRIESIDGMMKRFGENQKSQDYLLTGFTLKYFLRKRIKEFDDNKISTLVLNFEEIKTRIKNKTPIKKYNKVSKIAARTLFGSDFEDENSKWASLVEVSHIYKKDGVYQFRVVCFLPKIVTYDDINIKFDISSVIDVIRDLLNEVLGDSIKIGEVWSGMEIFDNLFED
ncbi:MAG: RAMP superfamily protein [Candidatus Argoarchaeum ethanivorans]|uniref:RAMP superfamily protein n=1 Tax=Candidatus Argoarchaeum ethanivorans TaxID=2608793 RepID=A0A811TA44_9EURY|nr:MAG: RAMP superfamily protein [Candidatus Argoarchaeum ethanivorans]